MKNLYSIFGLDFRMFIDFVRDLPSASRYAMRR